MIIERLRIVGLRHLESCEIRLPADGALFAGCNGAGKTTLIEAVYLLSRRRSFRGKRFGSLVSHNAQSARVMGEGSLGGGHCRFDWSAGVGAADAGARTCPCPLGVRLICAATHLLVEGEPSIRRRFVDWNEFNLDVHYGELWADFRRLASQRNAWLRGGAVGARVWDRQYGTLAAEIERRRAQYVVDLGVRFRQVCGSVPGFLEFDLRWSAGSDDADAIVARLGLTIASDVARGFTSIGPSRGDFSVVRGGRRWVGSRGENKFVGVLLQVAAEGLSFERLGRRAIWLIDDLSSELDPDRVFLALDLVREWRGQVIVTALPDAELCSRRPSGLAMFHVEHGRLSSLGPPTAANGRSALGSLLPRSQVPRDLEAAS